MASLHFVTIHGNTNLRDDMSEVGNGWCPKLTLGVLDEELVGAKNIEHRLDMLQMLRPRILTSNTGAENLTV